MESTQSSFLGGMNLFGSDTDLQDNQYRVGFNVRNRFNGLQQVPKAIEDTKIPAGKKQALVFFGNYLLCFVAGKCYYRLHSEEEWALLDNFTMSNTVNKLHVEPVPVNTKAFIRFSANIPISPD